MKTPTTDLEWFQFAQELATLYPEGYFFVPDEILKILEAYHAKGAKGRPSPNRGVLCMKDAYMLSPRYSYKYVTPEIMFSVFEEYEKFPKTNRRILFFGKLARLRQLLP